MNLRLILIQKDSIDHCWQLLWMDSAYDGYGPANPRPVPWSYTPSSTPLPSSFHGISRWDTLGVSCWWNRIGPKACFRFGGGKWIFPWRGWCRRRGGAVRRWWGLKPCWTMTTGLTFWFWPAWQYQPLKTFFFGGKQMTSGDVLGFWGFCNEK